MSTQTIVQSVNVEGTTRPPPAAQIERLDRLIRDAEKWREDQEAYVREVALVSGNTAPASFELQRVQLLIALLREGRERMSDPK